ncbi:MAG: chemotaxis protein CheD [Cyclobacteriaceae bacterium]
MTTILGSCVAVCLYDPVKKIGGINHFMLPFWNGEGLASAKYGNIAMDKLIEDLTRKGCKTSNMIAKLFGGANQSNFTMKIGERNVDIARKVLKQHNIKLVAESVNGTIGRKLIFDTSTGEVRMKFVNSDKRIK